MRELENILDRYILSLSEKDRIRLRALIEGGGLILGGLGSGKTSTLRQLCRALMRAGLGGLFCTVKSTDTDDYLQDAERCGRSKDVQVFSVKSGLSFDPIAFLWNAGRGHRNVETIIDFFSTLLSIGKQHIGVNNDRFWELASEQAMRHAIHLIRLAEHPLSIVSIYRAIQSFPSHPDEKDDPEWLKESYTAELIRAINAREEKLTEADWDDLKVATKEMTFSGLADKFMFSPLREMFCSGTYSFTPWQTTHERKIIIIDIPVLEYGRDTARLMQILVKLVFQRAWLSHAYTPGCCHGAMLIQDEFQMLMSRFESHFVTVCRGSAIVPLFATQSILNLAEEMGESHPGSKTKAFLNNLSLKIAHNCTCYDSCAYMADVIGKEWRYIDSYNVGGSNHQQGHAGVSGARQLVHIVDPLAFTDLTKPDGENQYAEAIVYLSGKTFNATKTENNPAGRNYLKVLFSRE